MKAVTKYLETAFFFLRMLVGDRLNKVVRQEENATFSASTISQVIATLSKGISAIRNDWA